MTVQAVFDPDTGSLLGCVTTNGRMGSRMHPHDCKCEFCRDPAWIDKQRKAAMAKNVKSMPDFNKMTGEQLLAWLQKVESRLNETERLVANYSSSVRVMQNKSGDSTISGLTKRVSELEKSRKTVDVSDAAVDSLQRELDKKQLELHRKKMAERRFYILMVPATILLIVALTFAVAGIAVLCVPALVSGGALGGLGLLQGIPDKNKLHNLEDALQELQQRQYKTLTAKYEKELES